MGVCYSLDAPCKDSYLPFFSSVCKWGPAQIFSYQNSSCQVKKKEKKRILFFFFKNNFFLCFSLGWFWFDNVYLYVFVCFLCDSNVFSSNEWKMNDFVKILLRSNGGCPYIGKIGKNK